MRAPGALMQTSRAARVVRARRALVALCLALATPTIAGTARATGDDGRPDHGQVVVYRCTDAQGRLSLRDSPCPAGSRQEARRMQRPKDAPVRVVDVVPETPAVAAPTGFAPPQVYILRPPRPLYECVAPDGARYTSDTPEGNPRRVPAWTLDYPVLQRATVIEPGGVEIGYGPGGWRGRYRSGSVREVVVPTPAGYGAETWVRDACHPLPQAEVCARLRERRDEIGTRWFNAQPSDRTRLERERRAVIERIAADC